MSRHDHFRRWLAEQANQKPSIAPKVTPYVPRKRDIDTRVNAQLPPVRLPPRHFTPPPPHPAPDARVLPIPKKTGRSQRFSSPRRSRSWFWRFFQRYPLIILSIFWLTLIGLSGLALLRLLDPLFSSPSASPQRPVPAAELAEPPAAPEESTANLPPNQTAPVLPTPSPRTEKMGDGESLLLILGTTALGSMLGSFLISCYLRRS